MRRMVITICPTYKGSGLKYNEKLISIESLPEYIEKSLERWQWHYDRMIDDEGTLISVEKVTQLGERMAKELQGYLPEYKIKSLDEGKIIKQMCLDLDMLSREARRRLDFLDEIMYFEKKLSIDKTNLKFLKDLAYAHFNADHFDAALSLLETFPEQEKERDIPKFLTGICHFNMQNFATAEEIFDALIKKSPEDKSYLLAAAENYMCIYEYDKAISLLERAVVVCPDDDQIKFRLSNSYNLAERYYDEKKILIELLKNNPQDINLLSLLSSCYFYCKEYYSSIEILKKILTIAPEEGDCYYNLALNYHLLTMDNLAVDNYLKALLKDPKYTAPFWEKGNFLLKLNIEQSLLNELISFGAEYGDENAKKYIDSDSFLNDNS